MLSSLKSKAYYRRHMVCGHSYLLIFIFIVESTYFGFYRYYLSSCFPKKSFTNFYFSTNRLGQDPASSHSETDAIHLLKWAFLPLIFLGADTKPSPQSPTAQAQSRAPARGRVQL